MSEQITIDEAMARQIASGARTDRSNGLCVKELVAWVAGEPHSDHPTCVSPTIASFLRSWNDGLPDDEARARLLRPLITIVMGTGPATAEIEDRRAWMAMDWLVRVHIPAWLEIAGLSDHARSLRQGGELIGVESLGAAMENIAAGDAAGAKLHPTVEELQLSAQDLVRRMAEVDR